MKFLKLVHDISDIHFKPGNKQGKTYISVRILDEDCLKAVWAGLRPNAAEVKL